MKRLFSGLDPDFLKLWIGQTVSEFGSRITRGGLSLIAVITLAATPNQMGILAAVGSLPVLLLGLFAGAWVDRLRRRPILIMMDLARMAILLTLPLAALTGHLGMGLLYVVVVVTSVLTLIFESAYRAYLPSLVAREQLVEANSRLSTSESLAEIGGPALAGVLIQAISAPFAIIFDALSFLFSSSMTLRIRKREPAPARSTESESIWREIAEGVRVVARDPLLRSLAICFSLRSFFGNFYATLYDIYGIRDLGLTPSLLGIAVAGGGVGALIGALLTERIQKRFGLRTTLIGAFLLSSFIGVLTPLAGGSVALATLMLIMAQIISDGAMMVYWINALSLRQMIVPNHLLGRTNASFGFLEQGIAPLGALIAGALATSLGARATLWIAVLGGIASAIWFSRSPVRQLDERVFETNAGV
ncbi:MAG TPA: MFS transporter [Phototrophicaceae bacterium]|nr:MFS transporter [Phototrophicaceae bacterium]